MKKAGDRFPELWQMLAEVPDPELPFLNIVEMGIVRHIERDDDSVVVSITPTYSGCPAMAVIENEIVRRLSEASENRVRIQRVYSPPWTTDWLTPETRRKLRSHGIAPPQPGSDSLPPCPHCGSESTQLQSRFGSTPCKALCVCSSCQEPFDYFKPH